jgi:hypothetical protein
MRLSRTLSLGAVLSVVACATGVDLPPDYYSPSLADAGLGRDAAGGGGQIGSSTGSSTMGGSSSASANSDGPSGSVAVDSGSGCLSTQKSCDNKCVPPGASYGCSLTGCTPCPSGPAQSFAKCNGETCDFDCLSGYQRSGQSCVVAAGGAGGGAGGGGIGGPTGSDAGTTTCDGMTCTGCTPVIQAACCKKDGKCGCMYPFAPCE